LPVFVQDTGYRLVRCWMLPKFGVPASPLDQGPQKLCAVVMTETNASAKPLKAP
jgi:hypothetical protein